MPFIVRLATPDDVSALNALIPASARALSRGFYSPAETEAAIRYVFGVNNQLIADGTYFVIGDGSSVVACGGWSFRSTLYGGDQRPMAEAHVATSERSAISSGRTAKIRAFFVAPTHARQGLGERLMDACVKAATAAGFERLELMSTLPGVPFYRKLGFRELEQVHDTLPDGTRLAFVRMDRAIVTPAI